MTPPDIAAVAGKLTKGQSEVLFALVPRKGLRAQEIAHKIGRRPSKDYRLTVGRSALSLCDLGLAHWIRSRPDQWGVRMFFPNEAGLALRQHLLENGSQS